MSIEHNEFGEELCGHGYPFVDGCCYDCQSDDSRPESAAGPGRNLTGVYDHPGW